MPMIEGFGDEVTYAMMVLLAIIVISACWLSTQLRFIPFVNVFILESMQDLVDTNAAHREIVVSVEQEIPAEATPPRDDVPQTPEESDNATETANSQAEALKRESEDVLAEGGEGQEDGDKENSEEPSETQMQNGNANSSGTPDSVEPASENSRSNLTAESVAYQETQNMARKVNIKLIYMNNTHRIVQARLSDTIGDFRRLHFEKELSENKSVRFIFHGKSLSNDRCTLESCNVKRNSVIHCLVTPSLAARRTEEMVSNATVRSADARNRLDISFELILYPSIIIIFAVLWYLQVAFEQTFLYPCIMSILGVSFFLFATCLPIYRTMRIRAARRTA